WAIGLLSGGSTFRKMLFRNPVLYLLNMLSSVLNTVTTILNYRASFNEIEWITSRQYNERELESSMRNFIRERDLSLIWLNKISNPDLDSKHIGDGINKKNISAGDLLASWMGHDLFHMKQIILLKWDILKKWSEPFSPEYSGFYD
ncbi:MULTISPECIES: hypothetical protein, partial [unclassified Oceanispirochaeta]|uniref:hypothetical protein n=1 Tax=unclassified Oceanispirochaeta TaxID=2635722 RepID=UPI000E166B5B